MKIVEMPLDFKEQKLIIVDYAKYIGDFAVRIKFNDGTERLIDFKPFLSHSHHPSIKKYLNEENFKNFEVRDGNLNWNDYDLIFPVSDLYEGRIN